MLDPRPVGYVIGLLVLALGVAMGAPALVDIASGNTNWRGFMLAAGFTVFIGGAFTTTCSDRRRQGLSLQQTFLLTTGAWLALPIFGALPFWFGAPNASYVDAFFEAMSGLTTTGSTVFT
ncbi:MAG: potassium transporter TrkH, partial [Pikeienuella sp.]